MEEMHKLAWSMENASAAVLRTPTLSLVYSVAEGTVLSCLSWPHLYILVLLSGFLRFEP